MPEHTNHPPPHDVPPPVRKPRARWLPSLVWLIPLVAAVVGLSLLINTLASRGPEITVTFRTAEGLTPGKTPVRYKDVDIGLVKTARLAADRSHVIATIALTKDAETFAVADTRFWVVRPRFATSGVSGLETLLSGAYIGVDAGKSSETTRSFTGLEVPPTVTADASGRQFVLRAQDLGSLDIGSPVYYRRVQVGHVVAYQLEPNGHDITLRIFVNKPYDKLVCADTRFWHASGVDVSLDTTGVKVNTQSMVAILIGGIAFQSPPESQGGAPAQANAEFDLFHDRAEAMKRHDRIADTYVLIFKESVRGLTVGAPVDFRGIVVGEVTAIYTRFDREKRDFSIPVEIRVYPERFTSRYEGGGKGGRLTDNPHELAQFLVEHGFRGQLRTGNLLTGQLYVAFDFFPAAPKAKVDWDAKPPEFPTVPGGLQSLQESVTALVAKLNKVPFEGIGDDLRKSLQDADGLLKTLNTDVAPEARAAMASARTALDSANNALAPDSTLTQSTAETMRELSRTAASLRALADYLESHPEALLRGKTEDKK